MIQYNSFFRKFVLRLEGQFLQPPLPLLERFELPNMAMVHYLSPSITNPWPTEDMLFYQNNQKPIRVQHHILLAETKGNPRLVPNDVKALMREFRSRNPRFKQYVDLEAMKREPRNIVTQNYGLLLNRYKYQRNLFAFSNRWNNIYATIFKTIGENVHSDYHQYVELTLPKNLPARSLLDRAAAGMSPALMKIFNTPEALFLLHVWTWLGEDRESGLFHKYVPDVNMVKFVIKEGNRFSVLDLSLLNQWRKPSAKEKELWEAERLANPGTPALKKGRWQPVELQKVFLRYLMAIMELRIRDVPEALGDDGTDPTMTSDQDADLVDKLDNGLSQSDSDNSKPRSATIDTELSEEEAFHGNTDEVDRLNLMAEIDKDLEVLEGMSFETESLGDTTDDNFEDPDTANGDVIGNDDGVVAPAGETVSVIEYFPETTVEAFKALVNRAADKGSITAAEYRRLSDNVEVFSNAPAPLGNPGTMAEFVQIPPDLLAITDSPSIPDDVTIIDKSMLKSSLLDWNSRYANDIMQRDVAGMVAQLQSAGIVINNYNVEEVEDISGAHYKYSISIKPIEGATSTLQMKIPKVNDEGNFTITGVSYRLRMQRGDIPIRKISPEQVALTSYYGKLFAERSQRRVNDWGKWICNSIRAHGLIPNDTIVSVMTPGNAFSKERSVPRLVSTIAMHFRQFNLMVDGKVFLCNFDMEKMAVTRGSPSMAIIGTEVGIPEGQYQAALMVGWDDNIYIQDQSGIREAPSIEEILGLDTKKAPVEFAELKVFGKMIPIGVILGYLLGFDNLFKIIPNSSVREVPVGTRLNLVDDEFAINFDDKSYVLSRRDHLAAMVFGGWREFVQTTSRFPASEFNKKDVYFNLFEEKKLGVRYLRELDLLEQLFIDPITKGLLEEMKEPVVFTKLLIRSAELLCNDQHPDSQDTKYMRIKGYERFAGAAYAEMVRSVRIHNGRPGKHRYGVDLNPYAVWIAIQQDPAKDQVSEINPIQNLKENEAVTYSGTGGRQSRSMVKATRIYHKNDMGVISESTVDSSDVAINVFTSADPQFNSLRGTSKDYDFDKQGATPLLSTSALVSPGSTKDDPKRVNFIGIQNRHVVSCDGYGQAIVRTGYEKVIPHRVGDMFAVTAKKPGKVVSLKPTGMIVEYADGKRQGIVIGKRYGNASGLTIPHLIKTDMVEGQTFEIGEPIAYNTGFFERDWLNPKQILWKSSTLAKVVLMESPDTLEDSSAISTRLTKKLVTEQTKIKDIVINFDQVIHRMVKAGDDVEPESILCIIEDALSARNQFLDEETLDTLRVLGAKTPQAKVKGKVERVEVYYNGDLEDMSDSLRTIAMTSDKRLVTANNSVGRKPYSGSVTDEFRIGTDPLLIDTACIRVYMSTKVSTGVGDKGVFGNQMKTVFGRVFNDNITTESGTPIDAVFGAKSVADRIVTSPYLIGTTTTLLLQAGKRVTKAYRS